MSDKLTKRVLIDWLSVSFDFVDIHHSGHKTFSVLDGDGIKGLLDIFGVQKPFRELPDINAVNGYLECSVIGEHVKLLYGGEQTRNGKGNLTMQLLMSGEACREFENYLNGDWERLLSYLYERKSTFKRIDIAIDDFMASEISIYDVEKFIRDGDYTSPMHNKMGVWVIGPVNGFSDSSKGYSLTFGSPGSTQLQIYDKNLERLNRDKEDLNTEIWYRYEMRFVDPKANKVAEMYLSSVIENDSESFMSYAKDLLWSMLDLKDPSDRDANVSRRKTDTKWLRFIDSLQKIDIKTRSRPETTIDTMLGWKRHSLPMVEAKTYAALDDRAYTQHTLRQRIAGLSNMDDHDIEIVNNHRRESGKAVLTINDVLKMIERLQNELEMLGCERWTEDA